MKKILILFFILFAFDSNAENTVVSLLKKKERLFLLDTQLHPVVEITENFSLNDCTTQRNLSKKGIEQSKQIGEFLRKTK